MTKKTSPAFLSTAEINSLRQKGDIKWLVYATKGRGWNNGKGYSISYIKKVLNGTRKNQAILWLLERMIIGRETLAKNEHILSITQQSQYN